MLTVTPIIERHQSFSGPTGGKKKKYDGMSAVEKVRADIEKKYGKGAIMDTKKKRIKKRTKK